MPAMLKILIVFVAMLMLTRVKVPLGIALMLGGIGLNIWAGHAPLDAGTYFLMSFAKMDFWLLLAITAMVVEFGRFLTEKEHSDSLLDAAKRWGGRHGRALSVTAPPALIGLIPMPAGALCSAPLVEQAVTEQDWSAEWRSAVNYWFRHVWEYWWPLYPGVIVAITQFDMEPALFFVTQVPFTFVALIAGFFFLIRPNLDRLSSGAGRTPTGQGGLLPIVVPIALVILGAVAMPPILNTGLFRALGTDNLSNENKRMIAMLCGLAAGMVSIIVSDRRRTGKFLAFRTMFRRKSLAVLIVIAGVKVFQHQLEASGLVDTASAEMMSTNMSLAYVIAMLPFLAGTITGVAVGFTGASFPLVVEIMRSPGSGLHTCSSLILAYGFGYAGMMLSPVHLCLLTTKEYFGASLVSVYREIRPCVLCIILYSLAAYTALHSIGL